MKSSTKVRLQQIMTERNLRQVDILNMSKPWQEKFGITMGKSALSQYVSGKSQPDQNKLLLLANTLNVNEAWLMGFDVPQKRKQESNISSIDIISIYNKLHPNRQQYVYNYAQKQLDEQSNIVRLEDTAPRYLYQTVAQDVQILGVVSAGTGEFLDGEEHKEVITYHGNVPEHDYALRVNGDSMEPMFEDDQIIFVRNFDGDLHNGQIIIAVVDDEAFIKKLDIHEDAEYLVSLNPAYQPIKINEYNDFEIKGIVVL